MRRTGPALLVLKVEVGAISQELWGPLEAGTGEEVDSPTEPPERDKKPADNLRLAQ